VRGEREDPALRRGIPRAHSRRFVFLHNHVDIGPTRAERGDPRDASPIRRPPPFAGEVDALINEMIAAHGRIGGVIHAAGIVRDKRLVRKSAAELREVLAPKVDGIVNLDAATAGCDLDFLLLFASVSGALGNAGQADYAAANAFLDAFAADRNRRVARGERHGRTISLDWPYWRDGGMRMDPAVVEGMRANFGVSPLETRSAMAALEAAFGTTESQIVILDGDRGKLRRGMAPPAEAVEPQPEAAIARPALRERVRACLTERLSAALQVPAARLDPQEPLDRYGLDSVSALEVIEAVGSELGLTLAPTLLLEYPKISVLTDFLVETYGREMDAPAAPAPAELPRSTDIAVIAVAGRYPGADTIEEFWDLLQEGRDCVTEVPPERWIADAIFSPEKGKAGTAYCKWGGFLSAVDRFDAGFFGVSPRDAALMDPQERLFLQAVWHLLERAGYMREHLRDAFDSRVGVYVGSMSQQYHGVDASADHKALVAMSSYASIANRVSFFFDLQGPSVALDTMCSSGLHAVHLACRALQSGECRLAIAGGVNLSIHPNKYLALSRSGMLGSSPDSRSFADGDGYLPAEGVGAVLLKPLADAQRDGDRVIAVIRGSAANHGGHSAGFMVPSAEAQARLIEDNFRASGIDPRTVGYVEAAASGSALGDSIELRALTRAFRAFTPDTGFCAIGSVKSNMGHAEAASGMAQLTKVLLQLEHRKLTPTLRHFSPNPHIDFAGTPFVLQTSLADWVSSGPRRAAISSFGAGGSNSHLILEEAPAPPSEPPSDDGPPWRFIFSAQNEERLAEWMRVMHDLVEQRPSISLAQLAYTLRYRRERMACCRVVTAVTREEF